DTAAQRLRHEVADVGDIDGEQVDVIEPARRDAARRKTLRLVLERRALLRRRLIAVRLVINLEHMIVGIAEAIGRPVTEIGDVPDRLVCRHGRILDFSPGQVLRFLPLFRYRAYSIAGRSVSSFSATPETLRVRIASSSRVNLKAASS